MKLVGGARACFQLGLHKKYLFILNNIKVYFGVGNISIKANGLCVYYVQSIKDLDVILNHFDKYPLITKKHAAQPIIFYLRWLLI
jgi:hypothetical protein